MPGNHVIANFSFMHNRLILLLTGCPLRPLTYFTADRYLSRLRLACLNNAGALRAPTNNTEIAWQGTVAIETEGTRNTICSQEVFLAWLFCGIIFIPQQDYCRSGVLLSSRS